MTNFRPSTQATMYGLRTTGERVRVYVSSLASMCCKYCVKVPIHNRETDATVGAIHVALCHGLKLITEPFGVERASKCKVIYVFCSKYLQYIHTCIYISIYMTVIQKSRCGMIIIGHTKGLLGVK